MDQYDKELEEKVPEFTTKKQKPSSDVLDISSTLSAVKIKGIKQIIGIIVVAIVIIGGWELLVRLLQIPTYVMPTPSAIVVALVKGMPNIYQDFFITLGEFLSGYAIGVIIGLTLAALLTQIPFLEKIITPYIILLITTPTIALVPLFMIQLGFGPLPRIIAVILASGPMVMINAVTGFRRTDLPKIALAKSYGASTFQIFRSIRFPIAMPMIIVGLLVGGIFGLITCVASDMVGGKMGLGSKLSYFSSLARMDYFFAVVLLTTAIGITLWVILSYVANKVSWQE
jgi:NitT/TauT family transport system permease protein